MTDPDTIVARSTPPGRGAVALVRLSGTRALAVLEALSPGVWRSLEPRSASLCTLRHPDSAELLDRALVLWFPGPASYTGEDVVEISTHGGSLVPASVLDACVRAGARQALAGEFTQRAYLNGKLDLIQSEAIHDLIEGRSRAAGRAALHQLEGGLSGRIAEVRDGIVELEAFLVHHLDFPEEDDAPVSVDRLAERGRRLVEGLEQLRRTAPGGLLLREGALVVLAGPPNAGKSSLFNALVGQERAIVTEVPGTTRDAIEVPLSIGGFPFRLVDTAGLRDEPERVERLGIEVAHRYLARARIVLYCEPVMDEGVHGEAFVDRVGPERVIRLTTRADEGPGGEGLRVSVVTGEGLAELKEELAARAFRGLDADAIEGGVVTRERQLAGIEQAIEEIGAFCSALDAGVPVELASTHLRPAETALEGLLGIVDPDEVLDRVFREFCVGK